MNPKRLIVIGIGAVLSLPACAQGGGVITASPTSIEATTVDYDPSPVATIADPRMSGVISLRLASTNDIRTLDPQKAVDPDSITYIENLFVQLTNYDLETGEVVPEAATSWEISGDARTYTFQLRTDIPWVWYNPVTGETYQEVDENGDPRFVTAHDFEYGIKRMCHPDIGTYYSTIIGPLIVGCEDVLFAKKPDEVDEEDFEKIGVTAVDEATLVIELTEPSGYFLSMTPMWPMTAVPQWAIEEHEDDWIEAGVIVTSGRFMLAEWIHGVRRILLPNRQIPGDLAGGGNLEMVYVEVVEDADTLYGMWEDGEIAITRIPSEELDSHLDMYLEETDQIPDMAVFYIGFDHSLPPFDDRRVRAAFSSVIDREALIREVRNDEGLPMRHFTPPGINGAPPIEEVGIGYDPIYARNKLAEAGYPECVGFPEIRIYSGSGGRTAIQTLERIKEYWVHGLGCEPDILNIEWFVWPPDYLVVPTSTPEPPTHAYLFGWGPDYGDAHNWLYEVLGCNGGSRTKRPCTWIDDLMVEAAQETDPEKRVAMYRRIEYGFFGYSGEFPIAPIFLRAPYVARHAWLERTPALFGGEQWYEWRIDVSKYLELRGK